MIRASKYLAIAISALLFTTACSKKSSNPDNNPPTPTVPSDNDHILLGNPTNATTSATTSPNNFLMDKSYYKISYNKSKAIPNWVSWHLQSEDIGSAARQDDFRGDVNLPSTWFQVQTTSYTASGFDRGHNCPSGDRTSTAIANSSTFLMTNMIPQAPNLNQGPWDGLEQFIRSTLIGGNNEAYIATGNLGLGGYGLNGAASSIDNGNVKVPAKVWKVIVVLPKGNNDLTRLSNTTTVLAVSMPNDNRLFTTNGKDAWRNYIVSVNTLETEASNAGVTLNFFQNVDATVRASLKSKIYQ